MSFVGSPQLYINGSERAVQFHEFLVRKFVGRLLVYADVRLRMSAAGRCSELRTGLIFPGLVKRAVFLQLRTMDG